MHLLAGGCSFVWGDELPGWETGDHEHLRMSNIVAEALGATLTNVAKCGNCNDKIFRDVVDYLSNPANVKPTHVIVLWTAWQRKEVVEYQPPERLLSTGLKRDHDTTQFSHMRTHHICDRLKRKWFDVMYTDAYDTRTDIMHHLSYMIALQTMCDAMGIKLLQGAFHSRCWSNVLETMTTEYAGPTPDYLLWCRTALGTLRDSSRVGLGRYTDMYSVAVELDDVHEHGHPGSTAQQEYSKLVLRLFGEME